MNGAPAALMPQQPLSVLATADSGAISPLPGPCFSGPTPQWEIKVTLQETAGIPTKLFSMAVTFYNSNLVQTGSETVTGDKLASFFRACGSNGVNIPANGRLCGDFCVTLGGVKGGAIGLVFTVGRDMPERCASVNGPGFNLLMMTLLPQRADQGADLSITNVASVSDTGLNPGNVICHTITVTNDGPQVANNVTVTDAIATGVVYQAALLSQGQFTAPPVGATGTLTCSLGTVAPGTSVKVYVFVKSIAVNVEVTSLNHAVVNSSTNDPNLDNNVADEAVDVDPRTAPAASKYAVTCTPAASSAALGSRATYSIRVTNTGATRQLAMSVIHTLPTGATFSSVTMSGGRLIEGPPVGGTGFLLASIGELDPGQSVTINITVNVLGGSGGALGSITNNLIFNGDATVKIPFVSCTTIPLAQPPPPPSTDAAPGPDPVRISGGRSINLLWSTPSPSGGDPTPSPGGFSFGGAALDVDDVTQADVSLPPSVASVAPNATPCTLIGYKLYIGDNPNVVNDANVWKLLPLDASRTAAPQAPNGSYYALVAVYRCPDGSITDSQPTPVVAVGVPTPLQIIGVPFREGKNLVVMGQGFAEGAKLLINDQVFPKTIFESSTRLFGKKAGKTVQHNDRIQVRNPDGAVSNAVLYP
ncbi:MAG TPA: DUF11 domain-containing protein [Blastocatellia bacterium]|nr:DUF11 domain-containing protein [Blastocatellia bacterium]